MEKLKKLKKKTSKRSKGKILSKETIEKIRLKNIGTKKDSKFKEKRRQYMLNGGASYCNKFIQNPSRPQVELYNRVKELFPSAILNYQFIELNYSLDIAIPELKIWFESDGTYWHQNTEKDLMRQRKIENFGWKCIRYASNNISEVPNIDTIKIDIERISN